MFNFGQKSQAMLATVDPKLAEVMVRAIQLCPIDFSILEGARTLQRQYTLYAQGRSVAELRAAGVPMDVLAQPSGKKVTWTLKSKHFPPAGQKLGRAVDAGVYPYDPTAGEERYKIIRDAVLAAAKEQGVSIRWGGDWDRDGITEHGEDDFGHFELV